MMEDVSIIVNFPAMESSLLFNYSIGLTLCPTTLIYILLSLFLLNI